MFIRTGSGLLAHYFDSLHSSSGERIATTIPVTAFVTQRTKTYEKHSPLALCVPQPPTLADESNRITSRSQTSILWNQFESAFNLLTCWRDEAAHGGPSMITQGLAYDALDRLHRLAFFAWYYWR
jgi:hypothetical protein